VARGKYRGIGISCFLEHSGGMPTESALVAFPEPDMLLLGVGVQSTGQGHATVYPRIAAQRLGIPVEKIRHRHGDSAMGLPGFPSVASRSTMTASAAILRSVDLMLEKGRRIASLLLEAAETDIEYHDGNFQVVGTDRRLTLFEVAARAGDLVKRGQIAEGMDTKATVDTPHTFPNGCHVAEVEIDPDSGALEVVAYAAVDDCGNVLDHMLVEGQVQGALAQGLGRRCWKPPPTMPAAASSSPVRSWTMQCRAPKTCRRCAKVCILYRPPPTRSASKAWARPAPRPRSAPS
jgi:carbon-monoxide dehydrogenase large subunit